MEAPKCNRATSCSGEGGGSGGGDGRRGVGRRSEGPKPVKEPRRGLGVALLEKLRLEKKQKSAVANASLANSPYDMHLQIPNLLHSIQPSSSNLVPSSTVSFANPSAGSEASWRDVPVLRHVSGPQLWAPHEFQFQKKNFGVNPGLAASSLPYHSNPIRPLPNWMQRAQNTQHHPSSLMVSVSSRVPSSSTTVPHSSIIEHPSNQNYGGSYVFKRQEEKMIGFKRPYPFSLDIPPMSSSNSTPFTPPYYPMKASEIISCGSGKRFNLDFANSTFWEIPSLSSCNKELNLKKNQKRNKSFLTQSPPTQCSHSKLKSLSTSLTLQHQGKMKDQVPPPSGQCQFNHQQQWYNFIPPAANVAQIEQHSERFENCDAVGESIDLNLKL